MTLLTFFATNKFLLDQYKMGILLAVSTAMYAGYLALGGFLFVCIEAPQEKVMLKATMDIKTSIMQKYPSVPGEALDDILQKLAASGVKNIVSENATAKWTLGNSVLFSATLLTTVGYGHLSPSTQIGKVACMLYTAIGIPLTLLLLAAYVERLMRMSEYYKAVLFRNLRGLPAVTIRFLHVSTIVVFIVQGCFVFPAWIFSCLETSWSYLDALYYCFISLTTVGLGDYVPGLTPDHPHVDLYRFGATLYIISGVTVMMFLMALTADFAQNYRQGYQDAALPTVMPIEKVPICAPSVKYGTVHIHVTKDVIKNIKPP